MNFVKQGRLLEFTRDDGQILTYDLSNGKLNRFKDGKWGTMKSCHVFFRYYGIENLICLLEESGFKDYLSFIRLIHKHRFKNAGTLLHKFQEYIVLESYIKAGYSEILRDIYFRYYKDTIDKIIPLKSINKRLINILFKKDEYDGWVYNYRYKVNLLKGFYDQNIILSSFDFMMKKRYFENEEETMKYILYNYSNIELCLNKYKCSMESLLNYIVYKIKEMENFKDPWWDFKDYLNMRKDMLEFSKKHTNTTIEKYPRYLKSQHDIMARIYSTYSQEFDEAKFSKSVDKSLHHEDILNKNYKIILPIVTDDLKIEGIKLSHCVASYIKSIINGERQVVFLRHVKDLNCPLITLDIQDGQINQAEGSSRRKPNQDELKAIKQYAKIKKLKISERI